MVKVKDKTSKKSKSLVQSDDDEQENFIQVNQYLANDVLNDEQEFDEKFVDERDEMLIENLKAIDKKNRKRLRTEVVGGELDVNMS
jgi:hypothetical protein